MTEPESDPGPLSDMAPLFESCVSQALRAMLDSPIAVKAPFECMAAVPEGVSLYCILPAASARHYVQLVAGIDENDLAILFPKEANEKLRKDAFGEMANMACGLFISHERFTARFGHLVPSTPFFSEGAFTARKDRGLRGSLETQGREITLQITLRELKDGPAP